MQDTNAILQAILDELRSSKTTLGFTHPPTARYIYANRQYADCLWYFWDHSRNEHVPIEFHALTGFIDSVKIETGEYKSKQTEKLQVKVLADRPYIIQAGLETVFAKGLIKALASLTAPDFKQPLTIAVGAADTDNVLFSKLFQGGNLVFAPYEGEENWAALVTTTAQLLDGIQERAAVSTAAAPKSNPKPVRSEPSSSIMTNRDRFKQLRTLTEHHAEEVKALCQQLQLPTASDSLNPAQCLQLRDALLVSWAMRQGRYKLVNHARSSLDHVLTQFDQPPNDDMLWAVWSEKVLERPVLERATA